MPIAPTIRPKTGTRRCATIRLPERRGCRSIVENPNGFSAIRFRKIARECDQATRASIGFYLSHRRRGVFLVGAGAKDRGHDRYLRWSKERPQSECYAMHWAAVARPACFRFAGADQARRLLTTSSETLLNRR